MVKEDVRTKGYFQSWEPWHDLQQAHDLIEIIKKHPVLGDSELRYGPSDSRTFKLDELSTDRIEKWWGQVRGGNFKVKKPWNFHILIMFFNIPGKRSSNRMNTYLEPDFFTDRERVDGFFSFCKDIYAWGGIDYGYISTRQEYSHKRHVGLFGSRRGANLRIGLPGVYWANFIGPRYVNWIGEEKLVSLKTYSKEKLDDGGWFFTTREDVNQYDMYEMLGDEERIVNHLGNAPFFEKIKLD